MASSGDMVVNAASVGQKVLVHSEANLNWTVGHELDLDVLHASADLVGRRGLNLVVSVGVDTVTVLADLVTSWRVLKRQIVALHSVGRVGVMLAWLDRVRSASNTASFATRKYILGTKVDLHGSI